MDDRDLGDVLLPKLMQLDEELDTMPPVPLKKPGYADKAGIAVYEDELARVIHKLLKHSMLFAFKTTVISFLWCFLWIILTRGLLDSGFRNTL